MKAAIVSFLTFINCVILGSTIYLVKTNGVKYVSDHTITTYVQSWNGQLMINQFFQQGNAVVWYYKPMTDFKNIDDLITFKNSLHPTSSYFSKFELFAEDHWYGCSTKVYFTYPVIFDKIKEEKR